MTPDYMVDLSKDGMSITLTVVPQNGINLALVSATACDGRRVVVVWKRDGTVYPVVEENMSESESDVVWEAVDSHMRLNNFW